MKISSKSIALFLIIAANISFASNMITDHYEPIPLAVSNMPIVPDNRILPIEGLTPVIEWDTVEVLKSQYELAYSIALASIHLHPLHAEYYRGKADGIKSALDMLNVMRRSVDIYQVKIPEFVGPLPIEPTDGTRSISSPVSFRK